MGLEARGGHLYLYRNEWRDGRRVKIYLTRFSNQAAMTLLDDALGKWHERRRAEREARRKASAELRERVGGLMAAVDEADADLRGATEAVLAAVGFYRHHRGEFRMKRKTTKVATTKPGGKPHAGDGPKGEARKGNRRAGTRPAEDLPPVPYHGTPPDAPPPLIRYQPLKRWTDGADELFARARAGDEAAQDRLRTLLRESGRVTDYFGDLGMRATKTLIARFAGGDAVTAIAVEEKVRALQAELLGENSTALDHLLVRRILNGWVAVHALELELAIRPPARPRDKMDLESRLAAASKKMTQAVAELARVRRLKLPPILVNVTPPHPPRVPEILPATEAPPAGLPEKRGK